MGMAQVTVPGTQVVIQEAAQLVAQVLVTAVTVAQMME
jgi:hypothetical protein